MSNIKVGDYVVCIDKQYFGICGSVIKKYFPTACEEQIMIICENGKQFHGPTRLFKKIRE